MKIRTTKMLLVIIMIGITLTILSTAFSYKTTADWGSELTEYGTTTVIKRGWPLVIHSEERCYGFCTPEPDKVIHNNGVVLDFIIYSGFVAGIVIAYTRLKPTK